MPLETEYTNRVGGRVYNYRIIPAYLPQRFGVLAFIMYPMQEVDKQGASQEPAAYHESVVNRLRDQGAVAIEQLRQMSPETHLKMVSMQELTIERFGAGSSQAHAINDVLMFSAVLHSQNEREDKQIRKSTGEPYIAHPVEIATSLMGRSPYEDVPATYLSREYDVELILSALLHDVVEDVKWGNIEGEDWLPIIEQMLAPYEAAHPGLASQVRLNVEGLTDYRKTKEGIPAPIQQALYNCDLVSYRAHALAQLPQTAEVEGDVDYKDEVVKGMSALYRMFEVADKHEDPQMRLRTLTSCLVVKTHDVLNNLGDDLMSAAKLARAFEVASLARYIGSDAATAILIRLAKHFDLGDPQDGLLKPSDESVLTRLDHELKNPSEWVLQAQNEHASAAHIDKSPTPELPVLTHSEAKEGGPVPFRVQLKFVCPPGSFSDIVGSSDTLSVTRDGEETTATSFRSPIHEVSRTLGRRTSYFQMPDGTIIKIFDDQPTLADCVASGSKHDVLQVPESGLFMPVAIQDSQSGQNRPRTPSEIVDALEIMSPLPISQATRRVIVALSKQVSGDRLLHVALTRIIPA